MSTRSRSDRLGPALRRSALLVLGLSAAACGTREVDVTAIVSETGRLGVYGEEVRKGIEIAAEEIAEDGGIGGKIPLSVSFVDDGSSAERALLEAQGAFEGGTFAIIGPLGDDAHFGVGRAADEVGIVAISPWSSSPLGPRGYQHLFRVSPSATTEAGRLARLVRRNLNPRLKDLVLLTALTDHGRGYKAAFAEAFKRLRGNVETSKNFEPGLTPAGAADLVDELRIRPADGVLVIAAGPDVTTVLEALHDIDYRGQVLATSALHHPDLLTRAGEAAQDVLYVAPTWDTSTELARELEREYRDRHGEPPTLWAALGHDALMTLAKAVEGAGGAYRGAIPETLRSLNFEPQLVLGATSFDGSGEVVNRQVEVYGVRDGTALPWSAYEPYWQERHPSAGAQ